MELPDLGWWELAIFPVAAGAAIAAGIVAQRVVHDRRRRALARYAKERGWHYHEAAALTSDTDVLTGAVRDLLAEHDFVPESLLAGDHRGRSVALLTVRPSMGATESWVAFHGAGGWTTRRFAGSLSVGRVELLLAEVPAESPVPAKPHA